MSSPLPLNASEDHDKKYSLLESCAFVQSELRQISRFSGFPSANVHQRLTPMKGVGDSEDRCRGKPVQGPFSVRNSEVFD